MNTLRTPVRRFALRLSLALTSAVAVLTAGATLANAGVLVLPDYDDDVIGIDEYSIDYGDYDMDLRSARIDHQANQVVVTHSFDSLSQTSFDSLFIRFDTNGDWHADYTALYSPYYSTSGVVRGDIGENGSATCRALGVDHRLGSPGTVTVRIPRSCIGSPHTIRVNTTVFWAGTTTWGGDLFFADTAPGEFTADWVEYSNPVKVAQAAVITPVRSSKITVGARKPGRAPLSVKVKSLATPRGTLTVTLGGKKVTTQVKSQAAVKVKLPRSLKKGSYRAKLTFTPKNPRVISKSSKVVVVKIR